MKRIDVVSPGLYELRHAGRSIAVEVVAEPARDDEGRVCDRAPVLTAHGLPDGVTLDRVWPSLRPIERERFDALRAAARANDVSEDAQEVAEVWAAAAEVVRLRADADKLRDEFNDEYGPLREDLDAAECELADDLKALTDREAEHAATINTYLARHGTLPKSDSTAYALGVRETRRVVVADVSAVSAAYMSPDVEKAHDFARRNNGALPAGFEWQTTRRAVVSRRNGGSKL